MRLTAAAAEAVAAAGRTPRFRAPTRRPQALDPEPRAAQVWCLAISSGGGFVITGGHDRSLRRWERTEEPFFVEEEREKRLESLFEADLEARPVPSTLLCRALNPEPFFVDPQAFSQL